MATIFSRESEHGKSKYYGNLTINGKRTKRYLADDYQSSQLALKKIEYELIFNPSSKEQ